MALDGTGMHWDALGCANGKTWKDMERPSKTKKWKDYKRISLFLFIPIRARTRTRYTRRCMHF